MENDDVPLYRIFDLINAFDNTNLPEAFPNKKYT